MITVKQLLKTMGLEVPADRIKLVRHSDHVGRSIRDIVSNGDFELYQAEQDAKKRPFDECDVILSFIGIEGNQAEFHGAFEVRGSRVLTRKDSAEMPSYLSEVHKDGKPRILYELRELPDFRELRGRLVAQWVSTRGWVQKKDLEVFQILPAGKQVPFPGYQNIVLGWQELKDIVATPMLHRDWKVALSATAGIYRIVDTKSGKIYIGSAYGDEGIWNRWKTYAKSGHGGNKLLRPLDPTRFRWSIVRTLSGSMSKKEVIQIEHIEMQKHGSRAVGLNS